MRNFVIQFFRNKYVIVPLLTWFVIQLFKVIYDYIKTKEFNFKRVLEPGGMPSSHSAVVMSITTMVGRESGFGSSIFATCLIFSLVVMYDASGVRRATGKQAIVLNKIVENSELSELKVDEKLAERLGHKPIEVFIGAAIGIIVGAIA